MWFAGRLGIGLDDHHFQGHCAKGWRLLQQPPTPLPTLASHSKANGSLLSHNSDHCCRKSYVQSSPPDGGHRTARQRVQLSCTQCSLQGHFEHIHGVYASFLHLPKWAQWVMMSQSRSFHTLACTGSSSCQQRRVACLLIPGM